MAIDSSIYQNIGRGVKSVADYETEAATSRQNKLAEIMDGMKMDEARRGIADDAAIRQAYQQSGGDQNKLLKNLQDGGQYKAGQALQKTLLETQKLKDESAKTQAETLDKSLGTFRSAVAQINTPEAAGQYTSAMYDHPLLGSFAKNFGARDEAIQRNIDAFAKDPGAWKTGAAGITADKLMEMQKGTRQNTNVGGNSQGQTIDYYGKVVPGQTTNTPITQDANNVATVGASMRGQDMTAAKAQSKLDQDSSQFAQTTAQGGKAPAGYRYTPDGNMQAIPGGPADLKINAAGVAKVSDAKEVLSLLDEVDKLLPKATGSYLGAGYDKVAGGLGMGTQGAANGAQLKALEGALIAKMPKMSGPQSDKDVLLYRQMAGQVGDETIPVSQRQAASAIIRKLNERYEGIPDGSSKTAAPAAQQDGAVSKSKSGKDIVMRGGKWEYK